MSEIIDAKVTQAQIEARVRELESISRIVQNTLNLIADMDVKGAYIEPVLEVINYHKEFKRRIEEEKVKLQAMLPKEEITVPNSVPANSPLAEAK